MYLCKNKVVWLSGLQTNKNKVAYRVFKETLQSAVGNLTTTHVEELSQSHFGVAKTFGRIRDSTGVDTIEMWRPGPSPVIFVLQEKGNQRGLEHQ